MTTVYDPPETFRDAAGLVHDLVARETGSTDFGPDDYRPGLNALLESMDYDPHFSESGRRQAWNKVVGVLRSRGIAIRSMAANPGFDSHPVVSPVVITGIPRTGTTALHRLLAVDSRFQGLESWLLDSPMPRPPVAQWPEHAAFRRSAAELDAESAQFPERSAAHFRAAAELHECCLLLRQSFVSNVLTCAWSAPTYDAWWQCQSEAAAYRHYARCVQLIGSNDPGKRWLLKNPGHIENLDLLLAVFPDARIIQTHRDVARALPSMVSLLMMTHGRWEVGRAEQRSRIMLRREVAKWARAAHKAEAVRERHPGQVLDVRHADFHHDPLGVVRRIYAFIGMEITPDTEAALRHRIAEKPELKRGAHRYNIADYGMSEAEVREAFGDYNRRHDLAEA